MSESKIDIIYNTTVSKIQIVKIPMFLFPLCVFSLAHLINFSHLLTKTEKIAALGAEDYLEIRAKRASKEKFQKALSKVAKVEPPDYDRL